MEGQRSGWLSGAQVALEIGAGSGVSFKDKSRLSRIVTDNGGSLSYMITKKTTYLAATDDILTRSYSSKLQAAQKHGVPVVSLKFLNECATAGRRLDFSSYLLCPTTQLGGQRSGGSSSSQAGALNTLKVAPRKRAVKKPPPTVRVWAYKSTEEGAPSWPEDSYEIAKVDVFRKEESYANLELHVRTGTKSLRVFTHRGYLDDLDLSEDAGTKECRYLDTVPDAESTYTSLYNTFIQQGYQRVNLLATSRIGSDKAKLHGNRILQGASSLPGGVHKLVEYLYSEATNKLTSLLKNPIGTLSLSDVEKAEVILIQLYQLFQQHSAEASIKQQMQKLSDEFYSTLPQTQQPALNDLAVFEDKQELVQLLKDMLTVDELTGDTSNAEVDMKYRALRCKINELESGTAEFNAIKDQAINSRVKGDPIRVHKVFSVRRDVEQQRYKSSLSNQKLLFHGSRISNWVGILSRGVVLPHIVTTKYGGKRTDAGMLGAGIYFGDASSTAAQYTTCGRDGTRMMLVCNVALGKSADITKIDTTLVAPPAGYDSVHGVRSTDARPTDFQDDEYVVYDVAQQRMAYLVEFSLESDRVVKQPSAVATLHRQQFSLLVPIANDLAAAFANSASSSGDNSLLDSLKADLQRVQKAAEENVQEAGLVSKGGQAVPLKAVYVRASLLDMLAKVVILQHYYNDSTTNIEAKYVCPLDENAAVCGFEAFINGKHIIGEVKEKEKARREYKEAVAAGHGAYLMDEEKPDVFTVSVGNLPPQSSVLIKITYVTELGVDDADIVFVLPASVSPPQRDLALRQQTQQTTKTLTIDESGEVPIDLQISVDMPYDIIKVESPSHSDKLLVKRTDTKATVRLADGTRLGGTSFALHVGLDKPYEPRMWVEQDSKGRYAAMLAFYPQFQFEEDPALGGAPAIGDCEFIFVVDRSSSMKGEPFQDMQRTLLACLENLPRDEGVSLNVISFGSTYERLFVESQPVLDSSALAIAQSYVQRMTPNLGGTELWQPLHALFLLGHPERQRNIFVFSDGHPTNQDPLFDLIRSNSSHTRVFTLGFGGNCSRHVLRTMARLGGGVAEFMPNNKLPTVSKIDRQFKRALQPALTEIKVNWDVSRRGQVTQAPNQITTLFNGERLIVYGITDYCTSATLAARYNDREASCVVSTQELSFTKGSIVHTLAARMMIRDWEDGNFDNDKVLHEIIKRQRKEDIINLSIEYSIVTQFTSFVAIEKREPGEVKVQGPSIEDLVARESVDSLQYMEFKTEKALKPAKPLSREQWAQKAKAAADSNKAEPLREALKSVIACNKGLTWEEMSMYKQSFVQPIEERTKQLRAVLKEEQRDKEQRVWTRTQQHKKKRAELEKQISKEAEETLKMVEKQVLPNTNNSEMEVFFKTQVAACLKSLAETSSGQARKQYSDRALKAFSQANELASSNLSSTHPLRLELGMQMAQFYAEVLNMKEKACEVAKQTFDDGIAELDTLSEDSYVESTQVMQRIRDELTLWTADSAEGSEVPQEEEREKGKEKEKDKVTVREKVVADKHDRRDNRDRDRDRDRNRNGHSHAVQAGKKGEDQAGIRRARIGKRASLTVTTDEEILVGANISDTSSFESAGMMEIDNLLADLNKFKPSAPVSPSSIRRPSDDLDGLLACIEDSNEISNALSCPVTLEGDDDESDLNALLRDLDDSRATFPPASKSVSVSATAHAPSPVTRGMRRMPSTESVATRKSVASAAPSRPMPRPAAGAAAPPPPPAIYAAAAAAAAPVAAAAPPPPAIYAAAAAAASARAEPKKEEKRMVKDEEEEDEDVGFGLFGGDDDDGDRNESKKCEEVRLPSPRRAPAPAPAPVKKAEDDGELYLSGEEDEEADYSMERQRKAVATGSYASFVSPPKPTTTPTLTGRGSSSASSSISTGESTVGGLAASRSQKDKKSKSKRKKKTYSKPSARPAPAPAGEASPPLSMEQQQQLLQQQAQQYQAQSRSAFKYAFAPEPEPTSQIQMKLEQTKQLLQENIAQVLDRGEKLDVLMDKSEGLEAASMSFRRMSAKIPAGTATAATSSGGQSKWQALVAFVDRAGGFWKLDDRLAGAIGVSVQSCIDKLAMLGVKSMGIPVYEQTLPMWATALALAYLELVEAAARSEWDRSPAVQGARRWLRAQEESMREIIRALDIGTGGWMNVAKDFLTENSSAPSLRNSSGSGSDTTSAYTPMLTTTTQSPFDIPVSIPSILSWNLAPSPPKTCPEAVERGICTFVVTGKDYAAQWWSECRTCGLQGGSGLCDSCAKVCHAGHDVYNRKWGPQFFCDCGDGGQCKCLH